MTTPVPAEPPAAPIRMPSAQVADGLLRSLDRRWQACRKHLKQCRRGCSAEAVHDARVEIRRYLATLDLVRTLTRASRLAKARGAFKETLDLLGPIRDLQVQAARIQDMLTRYPETAGCYGALLAEQQRLAEDAVSRMKNRQLQVMDRLVSAIHEKISRRIDYERQDDALAPLLQHVDETFAKVLEARKAVDAADIATIHRMRLAFKKFRYMAEALKPYLAELTEAQLEAMGAFQNKMGEVRDLEMLAESLRRYTKQQRLPPVALSRATAEVERQLQEAIKASVDSADEVRAFWGPEHRLLTDQERRARLGKMNLYLLRHAQAVERGMPGYEKDSDRPLTPQGAKKMARAAKGLRSLGLSFDVIISSPYLRARETADIVAEVLRIRRPVVLSKRLAPHGDPRALMAELREQHAADQHVLLVGHEPYLSGLASVLATGDLPIAFGLKKGGLCKLAMDSLEYGRNGALRWALSQRHLMKMR